MTTTFCPTPAAAVSGALSADTFRLEIVTGPDPDSPSLLAFFDADGITEAIGQGRRLLAAAHGPDDRYGELYMRDGDQATWLTTLHLGA